MIALGWTPASIVAAARSESHAPIAELLRHLDHVGGYKEDPLRKKSALLAAILSQRPEGWLDPGTDDIPPIVDYHCMRSCLRIGLVAVDDEALRGRLERRLVVDPVDEATVRQCCYEAVSLVHRASRRPMGAVDWFFFQNRRRCPEMTEPNCAVCPVDPVCAKKKDLFQPVLRTTAY
jgi:hypothetical protein